MTFSYGPLAGVEEPSLQHLSVHASNGSRTDGGGQVPLGGGSESTGLNQQCRDSAIAKTWSQKMEEIFVSSTEFAKDRKLKSS